MHKKGETRNAARLSLSQVPAGFPAGCSWPRFRSKTGVASLCRFPWPPSPGRRVPCCTKCKRAVRNPKGPVRLPVLRCAHGRREAGRASFALHARMRRMPGTMSHTWRAIRHGKDACGTPPVTRRPVLQPFPARVCHTRGDDRAMRACDACVTCACHRQGDACNARMTISSCSSRPARTLAQHAKETSAMKHELRAHVVHVYTFA